MKAVAACLALLAVTLTPVAAAESPGIARARELLAAGEAAEARAVVLAAAQAGDARAQDTLASMLLRGVGGARDAAAAMAWLCVRAHDPAGGKAVTQAAWLLAEYFRTGGGLPGRRYQDGEPGREDPLRAYFWFGVMAGQDRFYQETSANAARLGRMGSGTVSRQLTEGERQRVERRLESWSPARVPSSPQRCLELPDA